MYQPINYPLIDVENMYENGYARANKFAYWCAGV